MTSGHLGGPLRSRRHRRARSQVSNVALYRYRYLDYSNTRDAHDDISYVYSSHFLFILQG